MNCAHCGKRLSRKSARLIDGVVMCSKCMFTPAKQRKALAVIETASADQTVGLGPQGESANNSEYSLNTLETTMTPNETSPDQAVEAVALGPEQRCPNCHVKFQYVYDVDAHLAAISTPPPADHTDLKAAVQTVIANKSSTYKARNGRHMGIEADDGEMCWIVHSDDMFALETALQAADALQAHASPRELAEHKRADDNWARADYLAGLLDQHGIAYEWGEPERKANPQWQDIATAPKDVWIIGKRDPMHTGRAPAFVGKLYSNRPNAILDEWSGRWATCTHWAHLPRTALELG